MLMVFNGVEFMSVSHMCMVRCHMFVAIMVSLVRGMVVVGGGFKVLGCVSVVIVLTHNVSTDILSKLTYSLKSPVKNTSIGVFHY